MPRPDGQRLYPLIVSPQDWPRITIISDTLPRLQEQEVLLTEVEPLDRKNRSIPAHRMMSLNNYLIFVEPGTGVKGLSPARARGSEVAKDIMKLYESWR